MCLHADTLQAPGTSGEAKRLHTQYKSTGFRSVLLIFYSVFLFAVTRPQCPPVSMETSRVQYAYKFAATPQKRSRPFALFGSWSVYISCSLYLFNPLLLNVLNHPTERGPFIPMTLHGFSQIRIFKMTCRSAYTLFPRISMKALLSLETSWVCLHYMIKCPQWINNY